MFLKKKVRINNLNLENYDTSVAPFLRNGLVIDACVLYEFFDGLIATRIKKKKLDRLSEFEMINAVLDSLHITQSWGKLYVTPHILTEICSYLEKKYNKWGNYKKIVEEIFPMLEGMGEHSVSKENFCKQIDKARPVIEAGDISIFVTADNFTTKSEKIAILTKDQRILDKYQSFPHVLVMDYRTIAYNLV